MDMLKASVACVLKKSGQPAGTAFLVTRPKNRDISATSLLLTCEHVLTFAGALDGKVRIRFVSGNEYEAKVLITEKEKDLALLAVENILPAIPPLPLGSAVGCQNHQIISFGFPTPTGTGGAFAKASVLGHLDVQGVESLQLADSSELTSGFSGAPIWDEKRGRVIGVARLVVRPDALGKMPWTAFVTTTECVRKVFRDLQLNDQCPFMGLLRFTRDDEHLYKGRERAIQSLLGKLALKPSFLLVMGPSGSGKSSLVRAGLLPNLARDSFPNSSQWGTIIIEPNTAQTLRESFASSGFDICAPDLNAEIGKWQKNQAGSKHLLIIIDQFERLFAEAFDRERPAFLKNIALLCASPGSIMLLGVMRSEFYGVLAEQAPAKLSSVLDQSVLNVPKGITDGELRQIIEQRTIESGWLIAPDLVTTMIDDAVGAGESSSLAEREATSTILPLLEFALWRLWQPEKADDPPGELTLPRYRAKGHLYGSLAEWGDQAYQALLPEKQLIARRVITLLVRPGMKEKGVPPTGQIQSLANLGASKSNKNSVFEVIQHLADDHLIITSESGNLVQLAHDSLISRWPLLRFWVDEDHDFLKWRCSLEDIVERSGQIKVKLSGEQLNDAIAWTRKRQGDIPANLLDVIQTSQRSRHVSRLISFLVLAAASCLVFWIWVQKHNLDLALEHQKEIQKLKEEEAKRAVTWSRFQELHAKSLAARASGDFIRSVAIDQYSLATMGKDQPNEQIRYVIGQLANAQNLELPHVTEHFEQVSELRTAPDNKAVVAIGNRSGLPPRHNELALWNDMRANPLSVTGAFMGLAVSPDNEIIAVGDVTDSPLQIRLYSRRLELIATITASNLKAPNQYRISDDEPAEKDFYPYSIGELAFSVDGKRLFVAGLASSLKAVPLPHHWRAWVDIPTSFVPSQHLLLKGQVDYDHELDYFTAHSELLTLSLDGQTLFSGGVSEIYADDIVSGKRSKIGNHPHGADNLDISPSGKVVAGVGPDGVITLYLKSGAEWATRNFMLPPDSKPKLLRFVHEDALVIALEDGRLAWLDINPETELKSDSSNLDGIEAITPERFRFINMGHKGQIRTMVISPSRRYIATGAQDDTSIGLLDTYSFETRKLNGHDRAASRLTFANDSQLISGGLDGRICTWILTERYWPGDPEKADRNAVVTDANWDEGGGLTKLSLRQDIGFVHSVKLSPNGFFLASRTYDGVITLRNVLTGAFVRRLQSNENGHGDFAFSEDSKYLTFERQFRKKVGVKESKFPKDGFELLNLASGEEAHVDTKVRAVDGMFSLDGKWASRNGADGVIFHPIADGIDSSKLMAGTFSSSSKFFGVVGSKEVTIWRVTSSERPIARLPYQRSAMANESLYGDDSSNFHLIFAPSEDSVALVPNGGSIKKVFLWHLPDGKQISITGPDLLDTIAFSQDGKLLAVGGVYGNSYIYDTQTNASPVVLPKHARYITALAFSPDGQFLATGSRDRTVRLWDTKGDLFATFELRNPVMGLVFDHSGRKLFVAAGAGVQILSTPSGMNLGQAVSKLEKMTNARYVPETDSIRFEQTP